MSTSWSCLRLCRNRRTISKGIRIELERSVGKDQYRRDDFLPQLRARVGHLKAGIHFFYLCLIFYLPSQFTTYQVLSQLVLYYKRFEEIHRKCFRVANQTDPNSPPNTNASSSSGFVMGKYLVPISTITYEITKKYNTFA